MKYLFIIVCAVLGMTSCVNDYAVEHVATSVFTADYVGEPNTTIAELRQMFASQIAHPALDASSIIKNDLIVEAIVTGNDLSGNIYQAIYIQDIAADGTTATDHGGIRVAIKGIGSLAAVFPVGQKIRINLKGLTVNGYGNMPIICLPYVNSNGALRAHGPIAPERVKSNIQLVGSRNEDCVRALELTASALSDLNSCSPMLVVMHGCTIKEAGEVYSVESDESLYSTERHIILSDGRTSVTLYNSTSATFAKEKMPEGKLTVYGILTRYNSTAQLLLRSEEDVIPEGI